MGRRSGNGLASPFLKRAEPRTAKPVYQSEEPVFFALFTTMRLSGFGAESSKRRAPVSAFLTVFLGLAWPSPLGLSEAERTTTRFARGSLGDEESLCPEERSYLGRSSPRLEGECSL